MPTLRRATSPGHDQIIITWSTQVPGPRDPLPAHVVEYLEWLAVVRNRPATTVRAYRLDLAKFVAFLGVDPRSPDPLEAVDRGLLRRYQIELASVLPHARTRARVLVSLRGFLRFAYDEGWTDRDMSRQVTIPRYVLGDPHPIRTEDVPRLLAALPARSLRDHRDRALVHFLISSGCRIAEALALNRSDVRREGGFRVLGKGGRRRSAYLTEAAFVAVEDYLRRRGPDLSSALFISVARKDIVRGVQPDNRLTTDGARKAVAALRCRMSTDAEGFALWRALQSPHVARHTAATTLLEATNGDVRLVQEVLGHASLETLKVYTEITDTRKRAAYQRLSSYLAEVKARVDG